MKNTKHNTSKFWNDLYKSNNTGWDLNGPTKPFLDLIKTLDLKGKKVFIPGCGNGHDVIEIAKTGAEVCGVDFAKIPLNKIAGHPNFGNLKIELIHADIFKFYKKNKDKFDFAIEYTCYCAIDPINRKKYRDLIYHILKNGGKFISLFFPILKPENKIGPPFGVNLNKTLNLFEKRFKVLRVKKNINSHPKRKGNEVLVIFQKNG